MFYLSHLMYPLTLQVCPFPLCALLQSQVPPPVHILSLVLPCVKRLKQCFWHSPDSQHSQLFPVNVLFFVSFESWQLHSPVIVVEQFPHPSDSQFTPSHIFVHFPFPNHMKMKMNKSKMIQIPCAKYFYKETYSVRLQKYLYLNMHPHPCPRNIHLLRRFL